MEREKDEGAEIRKSSEGFGSPASLTIQGGLARSSKARPEFGRQAALPESG
jgi:hypothetical protein